MLRHWSWLERIGLVRCWPRGSLYWFLGLPKLDIPGPFRFAFPEACQAEKDQIHDRENPDHCTQGRAPGHGRPVVPVGPVVADVREHVRSQGCRPGPSGQPKYDAEDVGDEDGDAEIPLRGPDLEGSRPSVYNPTKYGLGRGNGLEEPIHLVCELEVDKP